MSAARKKNAVPVAGSAAAISPPADDPHKHAREFLQAASKITAETMARARERKHRPIDPADVFKFAEPAPGVVPKGSRIMAKDSAFPDSWAQNAVASVWLEGLTFLGYPYLAELTQRPEYRRASEIISTEMTRKWIELTATGDDDLTDKLAVLKAEMERLKVAENFQNAALMDGFFGRSHLYLDTGKTDDRKELVKSIGNGNDRTSKMKVGLGGLKRLKVIEPVWTYPSQYNSNDPLRSDWYKPTGWFVMGKEINATRLLTFIGRPVPDLLKPAYSFGGLSLSQMLKPYVDNWLDIRQSVADIIQAFSVFVLKTDLNVLMQNGGDQFFNRLDLFNQCRDNRGVLAVDKTNEDFSNVSASLSTLDALQAQAQEHQAAVTGIPLVKYFGIQPAGLNASSEGEIRAFYDWIHAYQAHLFTDNLMKVLCFVQLSKFGVIDPRIGFKYVPLWALDEAQIASKQKTEADTDAVLIENGAISAEESRKRVANDPDSPYQGLDPDDMPEPPETDEEDPDGPEGIGGGESSPEPDTGTEPSKAVGVHVAKPKV